ncbi:MAG: hypothetical protein RLZZ204_464 [Bacteroidota bacterium]|jgi:predicted nucleic acid-binding protein
MAFKIFLDANILLDFTLKRDNFLVTKKIMECTVDGRVKAHVTPSIIQILGYWLNKAYGATKTKQILVALSDDIKIIDTDHHHVVMSLHSKITDIEDAIQYYSALHHQLDFFISSDKQLKKQSISVLPVLTVEQFLRQLED